MGNLPEKHNLVIFIIRFKPQCFGRQEHPEKAGGVEETSGIKGREKSPDQNGYAGTLHGSQRGQGLEG